MKENRMKLALLLFMASLLFSTLACESRYAAEMRGRQTAEAQLRAEVEAEDATRSALTQAVEPTPSQSVTQTPTKTCLLTYDYFGQEICLEEETTSPDKQSEGTIELVSGNDSNWVWYYDSAGNQLGQLSEGLNYKFSMDETSSEFVIQLSGWVPMKDLNFEDDMTGKTTCTPHTWGHLSGKLLCHTHFWDKAGAVLGTIPENFDFEVTGEKTSRTVRDTDGTFVQEEGVTITLTQLVRIRPSNAKSSDF